MEKRAFVTGAGGFIGSHLVEALLGKGWRVKALAHYNSRSDWGWLEFLDHYQRKNIEIILGDVCDPFQMRHEMKDCHVVFHLAALIGIPYSYHAPDSYIRTNINGTLNTLKSAMDNGVNRFIHISTSEVYGSAMYTPIDEKHPLQGQSPYSASKIGADKIVESFYCSFGTPVVTVRPFNTYGPRQSARAIIPTIIVQAFKGEDVRIGSGIPVRDFTFVEDTVNGIIAAAEADEYVLGEVINLGTGIGISIADLVSRVLEIMGGTYRIINEDKRRRPEKSEVIELLSNNNRAKQLLGWKPEIDFNEGLKRTVVWLRENQHFYKPDQYNL